MCGLSITFCPLFSLVESDFPENRDCNSGQCMSADDKVKTIVGTPVVVIIVLRSFLTLCQ